MMALTSSFVNGGAWLLEPAGRNLKPSHAGPPSKVKSADDSARQRLHHIVIPQQLQAIVQQRQLLRTLTASLEVHPMSTTAEQA